MRGIIFLSRFITGVVFVFSGFVKAIDPLGSAYKFGDYFQAFGLEFLTPLSLTLAIFLAAIELVLGLMLLLGYQKKLAYWTLLVFMSFFTLLTFILAIANPVSDCGCFGDAIIMTNWQTFFKNLLIMLFTLLLFRNRKRTQQLVPQRLEISLVVLFFAATFILSSFCIKHLPLIDFRAYSKGTYIPGAMEIPEGMPIDEYETKLFYKNVQSGKIEEFSLENYPKDTAIYVFETSESKLVKRGYEPPIHDFGISNPYGEDETYDILDFNGYTLFMTSPDLEKAELSVLQLANTWKSLASLAGDFQFIPLTSSGASVIEELSASLELNYDFYSGDEIMLKTMVRSNPGFWLMHEGSIVEKWSWQDFPDLNTWDPNWLELIGQYNAEYDPEILALIEDGYMEEINMDVIDFSRRANELVGEAATSKQNKQSWYLFIALMSVLLIALQHLPKNRRNSRV